MRWLAHSDKATADVEACAYYLYLYERRALAERWHVPPWAIEDSPQIETEIERFMAEAEEEARQAKARRGGR